MSDPKSMEEILSLLERLWRQDPDRRFFQLIYIRQSQYASDNGGVGRIESVADDGFRRIGFDLFNLEDDAALAFLRDRLAS